MTTVLAALGKGAGSVLFVIPAVIGTAAVIATAARFGAGAALTQAAPSVLWVWVPLILWVGWLTHHPPTWGGRLAWSCLPPLAAAAYLPTPIWFWFWLTAAAALGAIATTTAQDIRWWQWTRQAPTDPGQDQVATP